MQRPKQSTPPRLLAAIRKFEAWRRDKEPASRIPQRLWSLAVKLAAEFGVHRTSRALRLDYK